MHVVTIITIAIVNNKGGESKSNNTAKLLGYKTSYKSQVIQ
jgi:hypothetical protein